ncbi:carbohydrate ABC transporter permease [Paenibacillus antri]|uniref:Carbohydrate ABC transporter permease n=1 Tax=Paenibacillus antri TaxID=2582848 RepID=A0A5R9GIF0_9BACL|nr:carbohydrate ABC transporter permease [Paenibacillus antri]TLS52593.1 carbohydrate ABC transporter permease [Paenibacillus antri]
MKTIKLGDAALSTILYTGLTLFSLFTLYPFINILAVSLNDKIDTIRGGIYLWPRVWSTQNYAEIFANPHLFGAFLMSVLRTVVGTALGILCTALFAYALSTKEFMYRKLLNGMLVVTLYVNGGLIPTYLLIKNLELMNTFWVYILPLLVSGFYIIIMRSYFETLPEGLIESAKIDGAGHFQTLFRIVMPVSLPVLATITLFVAVLHWNSWFDNFLYTSREQNLSLLQYELMKILLSAMNQSAGQQAHIDESTINIANPQSVRSAMTIIVTVPILLVYPFLQRYFVKGMTVGAMKE